MAKDMEKKSGAAFLFLASCDSAVILLKAHFPAAVGCACGYFLPFSRGAWHCFSDW